MKQLLLTGAFVAAMFAACPSDPKCPLHSGNTGVFTGTYEWTDEGKQIAIYNCPRGHKFRIVC